MLATSPSPVSWAGLLTRLLLVLWRNGRSLCRLAKVSAFKFCSSHPVPLPQIQRFRNSWWCTKALHLPSAHYCCQGSFGLSVRLMDPIPQGLGAKVSLPLLSSSVRAFRHSRGKMTEIPCLPQATCEAIQYQIKDLAMLMQLSFPKERKKVW